MSSILFSPFFHIAFDCNPHHGGAMQSYRERRPNLNTISVKASDLKASMKSIFPQITETEISIAIDEIQKENENQEQQ